LPSRISSRHQRDTTRVGGAAPEANFVICCCKQADETGILPPLNPYQVQWSVLLAALHLPALGHRSAGLSRPTRGRPLTESLRRAVTHRSGGCLP
jgi:hypothetical protein